MIRAMAGDITRTGSATGAFAACVVAALLAAAALSACSQDANSPAPSASLPRPKANLPAKKGPSAEELTAGMAVAPALGKSALPLDMKFELGERPKIGQVLEINLALVPQVGGGPATVQVSSADGLDAAQGESTFEVSDVEAGEVYRHTLRMTPNTDGVLLVNLLVSLKHDDVSDSKTFAVPVIVDR
jgi:hypothetical protein